MVESSAKTWSTGEGNGKPLQYSGLGNSMDRGAWQALVHGVTESDTATTNTLQYTLQHTNSIKPLPLHGTVAVYKVNIKKSVVSLYTRSEALKLNN